MTDDTISDTERAEEQLYAAIDAEDLEHRSEDSIYIVSERIQALPYSTRDPLSRFCDSC